MAEDLGKKMSFSTETKIAKVTFADTGHNLFDLPPGSRVVAIMVDVATAFSGGTTTLDIGLVGDSDCFIDGLDVSSTGRASESLLEGSIDQGNRPVTVRAAVGAGNTAGICRVIVVFTCALHTHLH